MKSVFSIFLPLIFSIATKHSSAGELGIRLKDTLLHHHKAIIVTAVIYGSAAWQAGIQANDVIRSISGQHFNSVPELIEFVRNIIDTSNVPVVVVRTGAKIKLQAKIYQPFLFQLRVHRNSAWDWCLHSYKILLNNAVIGEITNNTTSTFLTSTAFRDTCTIYVLASGIFADTSKSYTYNLTADHIHVASVEFTSKDGIFPLDVSYRLTDSMEMVTKEKAVFDTIRSSLSICPQWFKASARKSLEGVLPDDMRGWCGISVMQSEANARLLSIVACLLPFLCLLRPKKGGLVILGMMLIYPITWILFEIIKSSIFGFTGRHRYIPFQYIFFWTVLIEFTSCIIFICANSLRSILEGKEKFHQSLHLCGVLIGVLEIPLFFYEVWQIVNHF